jgi:hypothetical protein
MQITELLEDGEIFEMRSAAFDTDHDDTRKKSSMVIFLRGSNHESHVFEQELVCQQTRFMLKPYLSREPCLLASEAIFHIEGQVLR